MATSTLYFTGKCIWNNLVKPDTKYNADGEYKISVYLDKDNLEKFKNSKLQLKLRHDETEQPFVTFRRPVKAMMKGEVITFDPPGYLDKDNEPMDPKIMLGHGSKVTVKVTTYDGAKGKGHRFEAVRVDDLVEYNANSDRPSDGEPF